MYLFSSIYRSAKLAGYAEKRKRSSKSSHALPSKLLSRSPSSSSSSKGQQQKMKKPTPDKQELLDRKVEKIVQQDSKRRARAQEDMKKLMEEFEAENGNNNDR